MIPQLRVFGLLCVTLCFAIPARIFAQWQTSTSPGYTITCVKFLQDQGARLTPPSPLLHKGFIGGLQHISYCNSGVPMTWSAATISPSSVWTDGYVSDFTFKDTMTGWAAIYGAAPSFYNNPQASGLMKTTDGGATWNFMPGAPPEVRGVYYSPVSHRLICSSGDIDDVGNNNGLQSGVWTSTNDGATWGRINVTTPPPSGVTPYNQRCYYTGFASWDGNHIVLATQGNPNPCSGQTLFDIPQWLRSSDGGVTWQASGMTQSSWQPAALKNTALFYASSYGRNVSPPTSSVFTSTDNGATWTTTSFGQTATGAVTEVMGGDPCLIVAPDSNSTIPGNHYSTDDGQGWSIFSASDPVPPVDMRNYVGGDSIWLFQGTHLYSTARPTSNPVHFSTSSINFPNSGCYTSSEVVSIYGCNCTPPANDNIQITGSSVSVILGSNNFSVIGLNASSLCGPANFTVQYIPGSSQVDSSDITINYTVNGTPKTYTIHASGAGAQIDWTSNWGSKPTNTVTFKTTPCQQIDTFFRMYNPTCSDIQLTMVDTSNGGGNHIWPDNNVSLPALVSSKGDSLTIPFHAGAYTPGNYQLVLTVTTKSGGAFETKRFYITLLVIGSQVKPFARGFDIHVPYACNAKGFDTAIYYFDTTCQPVVISNIHLKNQSDPNFTLDLSKLHFPDTVSTLNDGGAGKSYFFRLPIHMTNRRPGTYTDSVIFEDVLTDGTVIRTSAPIRYTIDHAIDYTPTVLGSTAFDFGTVTPCDSGRFASFKFRIHDTCAFPDTLSSFSAHLPPGFKILHMPAQNTTLLSGTIDTLVIGWPDGYAVTGPIQHGAVTLWFKNGPDSNSIIFRFTGYVAPCPQADVEQNAANNFSIYSDGKQLHISLGEATPATFELQNLLGETVLTSSISGSASIDDRSLTPGVYFYRVTYSTHVITGKITLP